MTKTNWATDAAHSEAGFRVKHMMFTNVSGRFGQFTVDVENDGENFETSLIKFSADVNSIDTRNTDRDNHLRSPDFFDAQKYPVISFQSNNISKTGNTHYVVGGVLTVKDISREVNLEVEYSGAMKDPWGNTKAAVSVQTTINRKDFGLNWNAALETGGVLVGEEVKLIGEIQLVRK